MGLNNWITRKRDHKLPVKIHRFEVYLLFGDEDHTLKKKTFILPLVHHQVKIFIPYTYNWLTKSVDESEKSRLRSELRNLAPCTKFIAAELCKVLIKII